MATADRTALDDDGRGPVSWHGERLGLRSGWVAEHRPFLIALAVGVVIRVVVELAFTPAFIHSDGPLYLNFIDSLVAGPEHPAGYPLLVLLPLSWITRSVALAAIVQHLMGLATAIVVYAMLRHWGVRRWPATLAVLPVLFDTLQLVLEHTILSDVFFSLMLTVSVAVLCWHRRPSLPVALTAGLLLGVCVTIRLVGEPLVLVGVVFCLVVGASWRTKVATAALLSVGFAAPLAAYAVWYHHDHGVYALTQFTGKSLYTRSTTFVVCRNITVPKYQRVLCPLVRPDERKDPSFYAWRDPRTIPALRPPPGTNDNVAMREFAIAAIRDQPLSYVHDVVRDFFLNFDYWRGDRFQYDTAHKWRFSTYLNPEPTGWSGPAYRAHGGEQLASHQPFAYLLAGYQWVGYLPGPGLFVCLLLGLVGGAGFGKARRSGLRTRCMLLAITGAGLLLVPDLTAEFVWRYQLPALVLLPAGAALAYTALRGEQPDPSVRSDRPAG